MTKKVVFSKVIDRRTVLASAGALAAGAVLTGVTLDQALAAKKSQKEVKYQSKPKGDQSCANCKLFKEPDQCDSVSGKVAKDGWCKIWVKKA